MRNSFSTMNSSTVLILCSRVCIPVVTRFFCPPEIPLIMSSPIMVSAQMSSPRT